MIVQGGAKMQNTNENNISLHSITPKNILSFGPDTDTIVLKNLNVIIGPNGSGKSNLIEVLSLLRSAPRLSPNDIQQVIRKGGGIREWIWKGDKDAIASIDVVLHNPKGQQPLRHVITFIEENQNFCLKDERIENEHSYPNMERPFFYYLYNNGSPIIKIFEKEEKHLAKENVIKDFSILAQRRDPDNYPVIFDISNAYDDIRIYPIIPLTHNVPRNPSSHCA